MTSSDGLSFIDDLASFRQADGFGLSSVAERTSTPAASDGSGDAGFAGTDGLDLGGIASSGRSLASFSAPTHETSATLSSGSDALGLGTSFDGGRSAVSNAGSAALSPVAALPSDVSVRSDAADFHPTSASSATAGTGGSVPGSTATDNGSPALSNLGAVDTFHFAADFGQDTGSSLVQSAGVHVDPTTNATSDTSLGSDHVVMADSGIVIGTTHTDPLKDVALASQHGDEFHTT